MVLVSSSSSSTDSDDDDENSSETSPPAELARRRSSADKSKGPSLWVKAQSKVLSMARDSTVDSPKGGKTASSRRIDELPARVVSLLHKGKKHTRGHDNQTTKRTSHRLSVTSFSSDESSSDDEKEMRVADVDTERIGKHSHGSSSGLSISIKAGKFANGRCFGVEYVGV